MMKFRLIFVLMLMVFGQVLVCRDIRLEFRSAYFLPTNTQFKDCYKGSVLFGPELTVQLREQKNWYGFANISYFKQKGRLLSACDSSKLRLLMLAFGIKYFVPLKHADLYVGLGFQSDYLNKKNRNKLVTARRSLWGFGGIAKIGAYIHLPKSLFLDFFVDYSFVRTSKTNFYSSSTTCLKTNASGAIFGAGLGYIF